MLPREGVVEASIKIKNNYFANIYLLTVESNYSLFKYYKGVIC